jgi:uncharacterized membrane protein
MNESTGLTSLISLFPILLIGLGLWFSVRTRRGILFGVSVPIDFAKGAAASNLVTRYRIRIAILSIAAAAAALTVAVRHIPWLRIITVPAFLIGGVVIWQIARHKVKPHRIDVPIERKAGIDVVSGPGTAWFAVMAAAFAPLAGVWMYLRNHRDEIPVRFPIHWDIHGIPNGWAARSQGAVAMPILIGCATILVIVLAAAFMRLAPAVDRQRSAHIIVPARAVLSWAMSLLFCWTALLPLGHASRATSLAVVLIAHLVVVFAIVVAMTWRLIQTQGQDAYDGTSDAMWRAGGIIYYNPSDAAVIVPKRLGWGWTLNFGQAASWWYLGVVVVLAAIIGIAPSLLK